MTQCVLNEKAKKAVLETDMDAAIAVAKEAIKENVDYKDLIENGYTAGMTEVGILFGQKKMYLPQVMMASSALNAGVDLLAPELEKKGVKDVSKYGNFVICSIEGDVHSIGKDIVALMLKLAGFNVFNIGKDVPIATIIQSAIDNSAVAIGTSALMTSTMAGQKILENKLREMGIREKLLTNVGGAPVNQSWADEIGADVYSQNANDCVTKMIQAIEN